MSDNEVFDAYVQDAIYGRRAEVAVAQYYMLQDRYDVYLPRMCEPEPYREGLIGDTGDIKVRDGYDKHPEWFVVEVKRYTYILKNLMKCPVVIVDRVDAYDKKEVPARYYYALGQDLDKALRLNMELNRGKMSIQQFACKKTGKLKDCYVAPRLFWDLVNLLEKEDE